MANEDADAQSYEKIREEALAEPGKATEPENVAEPEAAAEPEPKAEKAAEPKAEKAAEPEKVAEPKAAQPKAEKAAEPKAAGPKADKPKQPRMICEGCGRSFSIHTKRHKCNPPAGFVPAKGEKKPQDGSRLDGSRLPAPAALPQPAPDITLADVTRFLFAESRARREQRRDDLLAKMF